LVSLQSHFSARFVRQQALLGQVALPAKVQVVWAVVRLAFFASQQAVSFLKA
jgi:hypothetical protein